MVAKICFGCGGVIIATGCRRYWAAAAPIVLRQPQSSFMVLDLEGWGDDLLTLFVRLQVKTVSSISQKSLLVALFKNKALGILIIKLKFRFNIFSHPPSAGTGFPKKDAFPPKDARFSKLKNIPKLLSNGMEGKIVEISTLNILAIGRLLGETLY